MTTMHVLFDHAFPDADRVWLEHAAHDSKFNPRNARALLYDKLPPDFSPSNIDHRFYRNDRITVLGKRLFNPGDPVLANAERVALAVRDEVKRRPGLDELSLDKIAELSKLSKPEAYYAIAALEEVLPFFTGSGATREGEARYFLTGPSGYDGPLKFTTLDRAMQQAYVMQHFLFSAPLATLAKPNESGAVRIPRKQKGSASHIKRATAFIIMAMDPGKPELTDVLDTMRSVCAAFGINAHRADEIQHQDQITNIILEEIRNCEYLIADLTHERPNVYYEVGYAHAIDKKPILYRKAGTPLHFDLAVHNVPEYRNNVELRELLTKRFEAILGRTAT